MVSCRSAPGLALAAVELAHDAAGGVDLDPLGARAAAQDVLVFRLDADLADLEARDPQDRVGILELGEVVVADRPT